MKIGIKFLKKGVLYFVITATLCIGLLVAISSIPNSYIEKSVKKSSEYFMKDALFKQLKRGYKSSTYDNYADCILVNIVYHLDSKNPFQSVIKADYAHEEKQNVNVCLQKAVADEKEQKTEFLSYSQYWHGSIVLVKPLLMLGDIQFVRKVLTVMFVILFGWNLFIFYGRYSKCLAVSYFLAFFIVQGYVVFFCVEYIVNFIIVNIILLFIGMGIIKKKEDFIFLMLVGGGVTCFFDFLTTETITLTLPIIVYLLADEKQKRKEGKILEIAFPIQTLFGAVISWGVGYAGMFGLKWFLSFLIMGKEAFLMNIRQAAVRIEEGNAGQALVNNIAAIWNLRENEFLHFGMFYTITYCVLAMVVFGMVVRKKNPYLNIMIITSLIPYLRYAVLRNHSEIHYFFTYRAQIVTVLVLLLCLERLFYKKKGRKKK